MNRLKFFCFFYGRKFLATIDHKVVRGPLEAPHSSRVDSERFCGSPQSRLPRSFPWLFTTSVFSSRKSDETEEVLSRCIFSCGSMVITQGFYYFLAPFRCGRLIISATFCFFTLLARDESEENSWRRVFHSPEA